MTSARRLLSSGLWTAAIACRDTAADPPKSNNATKTGTRLRFVFLTSKPSWLAARVSCVGEPVLAVVGCDPGKLYPQDARRMFAGCHLNRNKSMPPDTICSGGAV